MRLTPRLPKKLWEIVKIHFSLKLFNFMTNQWKLMDFSDFPMCLGKSGCQSHPPPKLRADLPGDVFDVLGDAHCILAFASTPISSRAQRAGET